jgi:dihydroorotate dehydrogenase electron transfer subunit
MLRLPNHYDPLLGRAFALFDVFTDAEHGDASGLEIVYSSVGKMTKLLARWPTGDYLEIWGPLGNGFPPPSYPVLLMVAGGIGYTPFMAVGREAMGHARYGSPPRQVRAVKRAQLLFGVRTAELLPNDLHRFKDVGIEVQTISDDGSTGKQGLASELLLEELAKLNRHETAVYCCGPEALMKAVAHICLGQGVPCYLSLETPMACGLGLCYSCVVRVKDEVDPKHWDYHRACIEGPVFDARRLVFD